MLSASASIASILKRKVLLTEITLLLLEARISTVSTRLRSLTHRLDSILNSGRCSFTPKLNFLCVDYLR